MTEMEKKATELAAVEIKNETPVSVGKIVVEQAKQRFEKGESDIKELSKDIAHAVVTEKVLSDNKNQKKFGNEKAEELLNSFKTERAQSENEKIQKNLDKNELFHQRFRPILEFDYSSIAGNAKLKPKSGEETESKSYGMFNMICALLVLSIPYYFGMFVICGLKLINTVMEMIANFSKSARVIIFALVGCYIVYRILALIGYLIKFYTGFQIFPF